MTWTIEPQWTGALEVQANCADVTSVVQLSHDGAAPTEGRLVLPSGWSGPALVTVPPGLRGVSVEVSVDRSLTDSEGAIEVQSEMGSGTARVSVRARPSAWSRTVEVVRHRRMTFAIGSDREGNVPVDWLRAQLDRTIDVVALEDGCFESAGVLYADADGAYVWATEAFGGADFVDLTDADAPERLRRAIDVALREAQPGVGSVLEASLEGDFRDDRVGNHERVTLLVFRELEAPKLEQPVFPGFVLRIIGPRGGCETASGHRIPDYYLSGARGLSSDTYSVCRPDQWADLDFAVGQVIELDCPLVDETLRVLVDGEQQTNWWPRADRYGCMVFVMGCPTDRRQVVVEGDLPCP